MSKPGSMARRALVLIAALGLLAGIAPARASAHPCHEIIVPPAAGAVTTASCDSVALGGVTPFSVSYTHLTLPTKA